MTTPPLGELVRRSAAADLLPRRSQARASDAVGEPCLVDALDLGDGCAVCIVDIGDRRVAVPARVTDGRLVRDPGVASLLRAGDIGAFHVEVTGVLPADVRTIDVDQSNDSVILGDAVVVKWQVDVAPSPAPSRLRALARSGITPDPRAIVEWTDPNGSVCTVLTAAVNRPGAEDGWTWAVDLVRAHAQGEDVDAVGPFADLGALVGQMHVMLSNAGVGTWSGPRCADLVASMQADLDEAVAVMDGAEGERLRSRRGALAAIIDRAREVDSTPVIPIHGDLHIGQVLRDEQGVSIIDFDGNPLLLAEERCAPAPAARDVAGMLASIDHVARVVNYRTPGLDPRPALVWIAHAQDAFLAEYQSTVTSAGMRHLLDDRLLQPMMIDQECREYIYSARHLPHWRYVPDAVITHLLPEED
ncbi:MAG: hypothetical protein FJW97_10265 [Actinobacteria bacterium]|nr:hypothetical protein [Actinomycetota bacterium]